VELKRYTLKQGTVISIAGVPVLLDEDVTVKTHPSNIQEIKINRPGLLIEETKDYGNVPL
jgi:hypothetical protein